MPISSPNTKVKEGEQETSHKDYGVKQGVMKEEETGSFAVNHHSHKPPHAAPPSRPPL